MQSGIGGAIDFAHSANSQKLDNAEHSELRAGSQRLGRRGAYAGRNVLPRRAFKQTIGLPFVCQQRFHLAAQFRVVGAGIPEKRRAVGGLPFQGGVIQVLDLAPTVHVHTQSLLLSGLPP